MEQNNETRVARYSPPAPAAPPNIAGTVEVDASSSLTNLFHLLAAYKWRILVFVAIVTAATGIVSSKLTPLYESTATVRIDRHSSGILGQETFELAAADMDQIMTTQVELIQSDPVLRPVAKKYGLPLLEDQYTPNTPEERRVLSAPISLKRLKVARTPNTYLIRISYRANDPALAAQIANDIAASYIAHAFDSRDQAYGAVSTSVHATMADLRRKMEASTGRLAGLEKELNMVDPEQGSTIQAARLAQLNQEFTSAQADRLKKEAALQSYNTSKSVAAMEANGQDPNLDRALDRLDSASQQFAAIRAVYGENNSEYRKAKDQVDELQRQVEQKESDSKEKLNVGYQQALAREHELSVLLLATKGEVDGLGAKSLQYQQLKRDAENDKKLYEDLERRAAEVGINNRFQDTVTQFAEHALPSSEKSFPNLPLNLGLAFLSSCALGICGVIVIQALDGTVSDPEEAEAKFKVDVIGLIPATRHLMSVESIARGEAPAKHRVESMARFSEGIRLLRASVGLAHSDRRVRTVLFTSAQPGEGKSTTAANLAMSFAQVGKRVLLVDADLRTPTVHRAFHVSNEVGLSDVLSRRVNWREAVINIYPNLSVMPAGEISRAAGDAFAQGTAMLFRQVGREYDLMFVDAPPLLGFPESHQLASEADGVIVVTKTKGTSGKAVASTLSALSRLRANVLGLVMTHVKLKSGDYGYGYRSQKYQRVEGSESKASLSIKS
jgi:succinoglycan biosynthesis transport protein ExoP